MQRSTSKQMAAWPLRKDLGFSGSGVYRGLLSGCLYESFDSHTRTRQAGLHNESLRLRDVGRYESLGFFSCRVWA